MNLLRLCDSCKYYNPTSEVGKAFPEGIPLLSDETHFEVIPGQVGETIYSMDEDRYEYFDIYRRIHPDIRFPILLTYDLPEDGEVMKEQSVEVEQEDA